jgi:hypothetical protein
VNLDCRHRPVCPVGTSRWVCLRRTDTEDAVSRGLITRAAAASLLTKWRVPMTPPASGPQPGRVYKGAAVTQEKLL